MNQINFLKCYGVTGIYSVLDAPDPVAPLQDCDGPGQVAPQAVGFLSGVVNIRRLGHGVTVVLLVFYESLGAFFICSYRQCCQCVDFGPVTIIDVSYLCSKCTGV